MRAGRRLLAHSRTALARPRRQADPRRGPLDPRHVRVAQFGAPTPDEKRHHFLHRFAPPLPGWGGMTVMDRSWYGRVLVERVEGFATEAQWRRAYPQIVQRETDLATEGTGLVTFWLHVAQD